MGKARASTSPLAAPRPRANGASPGQADLQSEALQADEDRIALRATRSILDELHLTDDYNVVLTARPRGSIPTPLWSRSYFVFFADPK